MYEEAKEKIGDSMSKTFLRCLERELEAIRLKTGRIVVEVRDRDTERITKKAFEGRFVVGDIESPERFNFDEEKTGVRGGGYYAVAVTKPPANRVAVLTFDRPDDESCSDFHVYDDFERFKSADDGGYPRYPMALTNSGAGGRARD